MLVIEGRRQSFRSTTLAALVANDPDGLLLVLNRELGDMATMKFPQLKGRVLSIKSLMQGASRGRAFKNLYVDDAAHMTEEQIQHMWKCLAPCMMRYDGGGIAAVVWDLPDKPFPPLLKEK